MSKHLLLSKTQIFLEFIFQDNEIQEKIRLQRIYDFVASYSGTIPQV